MIVVIAILATLALSSFSFVKAKAERVKCVNNLRNLYAGASAYVQDHESWPQIPTADILAPSFAEAWIDALAPYKIARVNWLCSSVQYSLGNPPYQDAKHTRIDYFGSSFDANRNSPWLWSTHPWFIERGDMHGDGNLIIFASGNVKSLAEVLRDSQNPAAE